MNCYSKSVSRLLALGLLLTVSACVTLEPTAGVDESRSNANKVLLALNSYYAENGNVPKSLNGLVPKYMDDVPSIPAIRLNRMEKSIYYDESSDWMGHTIVCSALVGSDYWRCRKNQ